MHWTNKHTKLLIIQNVLTHGCKLWSMQCLMYQSLHVATICYPHPSIHHPPSSLPPSHSPPISVARVATAAASHHCQVTAHSCQSPPQHHRAPQCQQSGGQDNISTLVTIFSNNLRSLAIDINQTIFRTSLIHGVWQWGKFSGYWTPCGNKGWGKVILKARTREYMMAG